MTRKTVDWADAAGQLAAVLPRARLHPAVLRWADARAQNSRETWGVAFSGGADSLALLLLLWAHWPELHRRLRVLHFDHRMRGAKAAREDAAFCRAVCAGLGVAYEIERWPGEHRGASEAEARAARLAFFARRARVVWFGHQQDDIAETMLMRLARGSGIGGLAAPRPVQAMPQGRVHVRPLLTLKKAEVVAVLEKLGVSWREDPTNAERDFFRNRVRRDVVPAWVAAAQRDAVGGAALARELLEEDEFALERWTDATNALAVAGELSLAALNEAPRAVRRRALQRWLRAEPRAGELSRQAFELLLAAVEKGAPTRQSLGVGGFAVIRAGVLRYEAIGKKGRRFRRRSN